MPKFEFLSTKKFANRENVILGALIAIIVALALAFAGSGNAGWWVKAPVVAAGIDNSSALITLENDQNVKSSLVVVRSNLAKEVERLHMLPSYFDALAVNASNALVAKRGIARAQCLNTGTGEIKAAIELPTDLHFAGASAVSDTEFLIWGRGSDGRTMIFNTNCSRTTLVAKVTETLRFICPAAVENQAVAIDFRGNVFRANQFFEFAITNQKYQHLDLLACGEKGIVGHLKNASGDFLTIIGPRSAVTRPLANAKGMFALISEPRNSKLFGLKHGKTTTSVSLFPIAQ